MFEGFGPEKLMMVLLIVLVLFGGKRIPEVGASLGKGIREFKRGIRDVTDGMNEADTIPARPTASLTAGSVPTSQVVYDDTRGAPKRLLED
ncbi:MAG TPA: twin-arginine translocase TatA/TatE family subunit [Gemmatimonadaceae bacterium]|nr:twin-arginine translocase TatA/TatE family subunit [Gemmatimonadaceae bacterium]